MRVFLERVVLACCGSRRGGAAPRRARLLVLYALQPPGAKRGVMRLGEAAAAKNAKKRTPPFPPSLGN